MSKPGVTLELVDRLVEAIAWWQLGLPESRVLLSEATANLLAAGIESPAVVDMASTYPNESSFRIEAIVERVIVELDLTAQLSDGPDLPAVRRMCRLVVAGDMSERELSAWAHSQFHHQSSSELLNDLAVLDDEYDEATPAQADQVRADIREVAEQILKTSKSAG